MANERIIDMPDLGRDPQSGDVFALDTYGGTTKKIDFEDLRDAMLPVYGQKTITENGTYPAEAEGVDAWSSVTANVQPPLQVKSVTTNGVVTPDSGYYGMSQLTVNVPTSGADLAGNLAPAYSADIFPVSPGQACIYDGEYYYASIAISTYETFNPNKWTRATAYDQIYQNKVSISNMSDICIAGESTTLTLGTTTIQQSNMTYDHRVVDWGFDTGDANNPPADVTITTSDGSYTINVASIYVSGATIQPLFAREQF